MYCSKTDYALETEQVVAWRVHLFAILKVVILKYTDLLFVNVQVVSFEPGYSIVCRYVLQLINAVVSFWHVG